MTPFVNKDIHLVVMDVPGEACVSLRGSVSSDRAWSGVCIDNTVSEE